MEVGADGIQAICMSCAVVAPIVVALIVVALLHPKVLRLKGTSAMARFYT
jgi:hypothetical protein